MSRLRRFALIIAVLGLAGLLTVGAAALVINLRERGRPDASPARIPVPTIERRATPSPSAAAADDCSASVGGTTAADVDAASAAAGAGTLCFPAGTYEGPFTASIEGQTWRLDPEAVLAGSILIDAPDVWIIGGNVELPTEDQWADGIAIDADRVTLQDITFHGGGVVVSVRGRDGTQILDNRFSGQSGTAIFVWGEGRGADDTLIEGNTITQDATRQASPIASRAAEDEADGVVNARITVRGNTIDQGDETTGWFGVELKLSPNAVITDNDIRGGNVLVSLPDSDGVIVSNNRFDLRGSAHWGVEVANSDDVTVEDNVFTGEGNGSRDTAVSMNSGSLRALITANRVDGVGALVDLTGNDHRIIDNCLTNVATVAAYRTSAGSNVDIARNGDCS
jgi:hypothetical protein